jgi:hypothetical protein
MNFISTNLTSCFLASSITSFGVMVPPTLPLLDVAAALPGLTARAD